MDTKKSQQPVPWYIFTWFVVVSTIIAGIIYTIANEAKDKSGQNATEIRVLQEQYGTVIKGLEEIKHLIKEQ